LKRDEAYGGIAIHGGNSLFVAAHGEDLVMLC